MLKKVRPLRTGKENEATFQESPAMSSLTWWAAGVFAAILGFSRLSYGLLLPAIRADLHGSYATYGLLGTINFIGYLLGTLLMPVLLARFANRLLLNTVALLTMCGMMVASALSVNLGELGVWRFLIGFCSALATVLTMALTLERIRQEERGRAAGFIWMGGALGILLSGLISPPIISTGTSLGWRLVWSVMGLLGGITALGFHRVCRVEQQGSERRQSHVSSELTAAPRPSLALWMVLRPLFQVHRLLWLMLSYCFFGCGYIIYFTYFIALLEQQGVSTLNAGFVWAALGLAGALSGWLWGRLVDRWPTGFTLALPLVLGALGSCSVLVADPLIEYAGAALVGLSAFIAPALITTALLKRAVANDHYAVIYSILTALFAAGQILGPLIGGLVIEWVNLGVGTASSALFLAIAALCAWGYGAIHSSRSISQ